MPFFAMQIVCSPATNAIGRPGIYLTTSIAGAMIFPLAFYFGIAGGPMGLVHAWWIAAPALLCVTLALTLPVIDVGPRDLLAELGPIALGCASMAAVVYWASVWVADMAPPLQLLLLVPLGGIVYGSVLWFVWPRILRESWAMLRPGKHDGAQTATALAPAE